MSYTYKYTRPAVTADCFVITHEAEPRVLLIKRGGEPFKNCWAIPEGFMEMNETTEQCAVRELKEETGIVISDIHQIGAYSKVDRDPRGRTISVAYLTITNKAQDAIGQDDVTEAKWWPLTALPNMAFNHDDIMRDSVRLYQNISKTAY